MKLWVTHNLKVISDQQHTYSIIAIEYTAIIIDPNLISPICIKVVLFVYISILILCMKATLNLHMTNNVHITTVLTL